jgi:hypothetical protein
MSSGSHSAIFGLSQQVCAQPVLACLFHMHVIAMRH